MAVRLLTYVGLLYQDLAAAGEVPAGSPLPPVLPIVLDNGEKPWWAKTSLDELIAPDLPKQLRRWQPQFRYLLLDEQRLADIDLAGQRNIAAALFRLENMSKGYPWERQGRGSSPCASRRSAQPSMSLAVTLIRRLHRGSRYRGGRFPAP